MLSQILLWNIVGVEYGGRMTFRKFGTMIEKQVSTQSGISAKKLERSYLILEFEQWIGKLETL
jgi:hypothetical protein